MIYIYINNQPIGLNEIIFDDKSDYLHLFNRVERGKI
jgi:hypothetical protein